MIRLKDVDALTDTLIGTMGKSKGKYGIRSDSDVEDFARYLIENS